MEPKNSRDVTDADVLKIYEEFWKVNIEGDHGEGFKNDRTILQLKRELYDYWVLLENVPKIFMEITGGKISKPHTCPADVISECEAYNGQLIEENVADRTKFLETQRDKALKHTQRLKGVVNMVMTHIRLPVTMREKLRDSLSPEK